MPFNSSSINLLLGLPFGGSFWVVSSSCLLFQSTVSLSKFCPTTIFWICRVHLLPQGCGPSLEHLLLHPRSGPCTNSTISVLVSKRFLFEYIRILLLFATLANFLLHRHLLHAQCSGFSILHIQLQAGVKSGGYFFHIISYLSLSPFAGMYTPCHSVLKGPWYSIYCSHGFQSNCR